MSDLVDRLREADCRARAAGIVPQMLVVQSMPFGALIDASTNRAFTPAIKDPNIAYSLCGAIKAASEAATEITRLRKEAARLEALLSKAADDLAESATKRFVESERHDATKSQNARLKEALAPFAGYLDTPAFDLDFHGNPLPDEQSMGWVYLKIRDFRRARAAYKVEPA